MHFTQSGVIAIVGSGATDIKMSVWIFEYISNNDFPNVHTHIAWAERFFFSEIGTKPAKLSRIQKLIAKQPTIPNIFFVS